jgi:quinol---cytochrome-c reductase cytochrome c subunit
VIAAAGLVTLVAAGSAGAASGDLARGAQLYARHCVSCHGMNGVGVSAESRAAGRPEGNGRPEQVAGPPLRGVGAQAADFYLTTGYMPLLQPDVQPTRKSAGERIIRSDADIAALVAYVASLGTGPPVPTPHPERGDPAAGMRLFTTHCAGCHQVALGGGYVSGAVAPSLGDATATQIAEAVRIGPYVMPSFPESAISDRELDSIVAYVVSNRTSPNPGGWGLGRLGPVPEGAVAWLVATAALVAACVVFGSRLKT